MKQIALWGAFLVLFLIPFTGNAQSFSHEAEVGGFVLPTSFSFIDADRIIVGEKGGNIYLANIQTGAKSLIYTIPNVNTFNDRGLVGLTTHNNFLNNGYIYLSYTHENSPADYDGPKTARIVRVVYDFNTGLVDPNSYTILVGTVAGTPATPSCSDYAPLSDCIASNSGAHSAGGLRFGPDGYLYASLGDGADFYAVDSYALKSLDPDYLTGKILRLNDDGTAPASNPFYEVGNPTSNRSKVYAMGIRNSFRFDFLENGDLVAGEVGWSTHEELNLVTAGANFGWPCYEGNNLQAAYSVVFPTECGAVSGITLPLLEYGHQTAGSYSLTGGDQATNAAYGAYAGKYFFGDYSQNTMLAADYSSGNISNVEVVYQNPGGPVDIQVGPDNFLYYIAIYTGEIRKLVLDTGTGGQVNRDPVADFYVDGGLGDAPVDVVFHGEISSDPDKDILTYDWNFGDGLTGSGATPTHTYAANGSYVVSLTVNDGRGGTAVHVGRVFVGDVAYNANPIHIVTTYAPQPLYVGLQSDISTNVSNISGGDDDFIVYWEIYNSAGDRVLKRSDVVLATDGEDVTKTFTWLPPGIDTYRIDIGIFSDDWRYGYAWIAGAAVFTVEQRDAETSTSTPTDPTPPPPDPTPTPSTCPPESDHDGDGWGWDGQKGCRVDSGTTPTDPTDPTPPPPDPTPTPSTCPPESDHDGDGWGWDGVKGCKVDSSTPTDPTPPPPDPNPPEDDSVGECYDWDGDGWGWDGVKGCKVDSSTPTDPTPPPPDPTPTPSTCPPESDHDGDGWGWDGVKGCRV